MSENPYAAPGSDPEAPEPVPGGRGLPWEDPGPPFPRAWDTLRLILQDPGEAGARIAARKALGPAIAFALLVGLPFQWLGQALAALWTKVDESGATNAAFFKALHLPPPPAPTPESAAMAKTFLWVQVVMTPLVLALGLLLMGLLAHAGLWMLRGLERGRGLEATFRTLLYVSAATAWAGFLNVFGLLLPGSLHTVHILFSLALGLGVLTFQGLVLGHAHGIQPWRGILAVFLPWLILGCCLAACLAPVAMGGLAG